MSTTNEFLGFQIVNKIGEGAFSATYLAEQGSRTLAIKVIEIPNPITIAQVPREEIMSREFQDNLRQTSAELNDILRALVAVGEKKGVLRYYDYHVSLEPSSGVYQLGILCELLDNLNTHIQKQNMRVRGVLKMGMDLCDGLELMLSKNICSGNIKESNLFYDPIKGYKLSDFFFNDILVQALRPSNGYSDYGYRFLAPEAYSDDEDYTFQTDMFTLGVLMYKLLNNGLLPYQHNSAELSQKEVRDRYLEMKCLPRSPFVDGEVLDVLNKAAAYRPEDRYQTYGDFRLALKEAMRRLELFHLDRLINYGGPPAEVPPFEQGLSAQPALSPTVESSVQAPHMYQITEEEEPLPPIPQKPQEGVPFTINLGPKVVESPTVEVSLSEVDAIVAELETTGLGPNERKLLLERKAAEESFAVQEASPSARHLEIAKRKKTKKLKAAKPDYLEGEGENENEELSHAYHYYDEDELEEDHTLRNRISIILFFALIAILFIVLFLLYPYLEDWILSLFGPKV